MKNGRNSILPRKFKDLTGKEGRNMYPGSGA